MTNKTYMAVWGKDYFEKQNVTLAFRLKFDGKKGEKANFILSAKQLYRVIFNGKLVYYGPERCAHGYSKLDRLDFDLVEGENVLVVEVYQAGVANYYLPLENAYFAALLNVGDKNYSTDDFICYHYSDRVENSQRYCGQRTFVEEYKFDVCRTKFYFGEDIYKKVETISTDCDNIIEKDCEYPALIPYYEFEVIENGWVKQGKKKAKYKLPILNRARKYGERIDYDVLTDIVNNFIYYRGDKKATKSTYALFSAEREISGFINLELDVSENAEIYLIFDEILLPQKNVNGAKRLHFSRCSTANVIKWTLKKGVYKLSTFEAYSFKYIKVVVLKGNAKILTLSATRYENGAPDIFNCKIADKQLENIVRAAYNTYRQNSVDLLMDCPSRERAGWINDVWFSRECPQFFSGNDNPFKSLLRAYGLAPDLGLPKGMIPMCYPSDFRTGLFMVACAMWYVCNLREYQKTYGDDEIVLNGKPKVIDFLDYLKGYENQDGLLENLKGKIFVEWSKANTKPYVKGVNFPTNMLYHLTLICAAELLNDNQLSSKAEKLKKTIIDLSFNGEFFEDNSVKKNGEYVKLNHVTEVCQYYAFECGVADKESFPKLYKTLKDNFIPRQPTPEKYLSVTRANIIIGLCIRERLAYKYGEYDRLLSELKSIYSVMAEKTMTLWEHDKPKASCNHGIAAFAGVCIIKALTGYQGKKDGILIFKKVPYNTDCEIILPCDNEKVKITVKSGKMSVESSIQYKIIED